MKMIVIGAGEGQVVVGNRFASRAKRGWAQLPLWAGATAKVWAAVSLVASQSAGKRQDRNRGLI